MMFIIQQQARTVLNYFSSVTLLIKIRSQNITDILGMQTCNYLSMSLKNGRATNHLLRNISAYFATPQAGLPEGHLAC